MKPANPLRGLPYLILYKNNKKTKSEVPKSLNIFAAVSLSKKGTKALTAIPNRVPSDDIVRI